jgi:hypothetical protein
LLLPSAVIVSASTGRGGWRIATVAASAAVLALSLVRGRPHEPVLDPVVRPVLPTVHVEQPERIAESTSLYVDARVERAAEGGRGAVLVTIGVPVERLTPIRRGAAADVRRDADGVTLRGRVTRIAPVVDRAQRVAVTIAAPDPGRFLRRGDEVAVQVSSPLREMLVVPLAATTLIGGATSVFVARGTRFEPTPVELGRTFGERVEVLDGLAADDRVVVDGVLALKSALP